MTLKNNGKNYELFVATIQKSLHKLESDEKLKNIVIETNKKIIDNNGITREFDVYWEFIIGNITYKTVIECKDYQSAISVEKIDAFIGKTNDIPGLRLIYATKVGYQSGATIKANKYNIDLLIIREVNEDDWTDEDGNPLIKEAVINLHVLSPPKIISTNIFIENKQDEKLFSELSKNNFNNQIFINDIENNIRYSHLELENKLLEQKIPNMEYGNGEYSETLNNAYIENEDASISIKIKGYNLKYVFKKPIYKKINIDFSEKILGIVQNYNKNNKTFILKE